MKAVYDCKRSIRVAALVVVTTGGGLTGLPSMAQNTVVGLEEVVVTARKREENLQDVSMSITAISSQEIEKLGLSNIADVSRLDASLIYDKGYSATDNRISIRGLSPTRGRVTVAVLVDGIDVSSESIQFGGGSLLATNRLMDLHAVEIAKGPQSALYGRSAFAGAVQYVTKDPSTEPEGSVRASYSDYGRYEVTTSYSDAVTDTFGLRFNAAYWNQDGIYKNEVTGAKVGDGDGWGAALTGKWTPSTTVDIKARLEFTDDHYGPSPIALMPINAVLARPTAGSTCLTGAGAPVATVMGACPSGSARVYAPTSPFGIFPSSNHVYANRGEIPDAGDLAVRFDRNPLTGSDYNGTDRQIARGSVVVNWNLGPGTLTSLTGYTDATFSFDEDGDFDSGIRNGGPDRSGRAARFDYDNDTKQISQELRYRSDLDGPLNFTFGGLYWNEDVEQISRSINIFCLGPVPPFAFGNPLPLPASCGNFTANQVLGQMTAIPRLNAREIDHKSVFGQLEWRFADTWKLSLEGRYSDETETVRGVDCGLPTLPAGIAGPFPIPCNDPSLAGFQVFGPSINLLYPFFNTLQFFGVPPPYPPAVGVTQAPGVPVRLQSEHTSFAPRATLEMKPTDNSLVYLTWAKGVKPGGISTVTSGAWQDADYDGSYAEATFKDETVTEYELGAKTQFWNGRLRLNPAIFFIDYKDKQVGAQLVTPSGIQTGRLLNAGKAEVKGLEIDAELAPNDNWFFKLNYAYLDGEFTDFPFTSTSPTDAARFGDCPRSTGSTADLRQCFINLKGNKLERAPKQSVVLLGRYTVPVGSGSMKFYVEGDVQSQSEREVDIWNTVQLPSYTRGNLRLGLTTDKWDALLYVDNVTDDDTVLTANAYPGDVAQELGDPTNFSPADQIGVALPDPRIIGVRFNYRFAQ
ncbi:MAG: TonB-dependent receptor [Steroidobacteraceae bacterium]|nr:TonB-dependent receptor [Steroidobacteraceae bacterium]